jgi:hypothetical protein
MWVGWLSLATGCIGERQYTIVEKHVTPNSFKFVTLVDKKGRGAGGWRVACLHLVLQHDVGASYVCKVGVELPLKRGEEGTLHLLRAKRLAADCANAAADVAFASTTRATPLGIACTHFINTYRAILWEALVGSRVVTNCLNQPESAAP